MTKRAFGDPEPGANRSFDADRWRELGFSEESGLNWWRHRIDPPDALRWQRAEVTEPIDAVRWKIAGIGPNTVREWVYAKIDAREAVAWTELGFTVVDAPTGCAWRQRLRRRHPSLFPPVPSLTHATSSRRSAAVTRG
jgi:hypothetical protein